MPIQTTPVSAPHASPAGDLKRQLAQNLACDSTCEGRLPRRPLEGLRRSLEAAQPPSVTGRSWGGASDNSPVLSRQKVLQALAAALESRTDLVISVSHDDYETNFGGVQNVIRDERTKFETLGWSYLHLSPATPLPTLARPTPGGAFRFAVRLGSQRLGVVTAADLTAVLSAVKPDESRILLVIHHLKGHAPETLLELVRLATEPTVVWIHDYFTICTNYALMRNDVRFCAAPPIATAGCVVCVYSDDRREQLPRIQSFFEAVNPIALAPSKAALELWLSRSGLPCRDAAVQPLARLILAPQPEQSIRTRDDACLRIAHLGQRSVLKGWPVFEELAIRHCGRPDYAFFQLGYSGGPAMPKCIQNVPVLVDRDRPDAMIEAIAEYRIDFVVSWSLWPETFCIAVHEALAGGAYVLARSDAGNVGSAILPHVPDQARIVEDERSLFALFEDAELKGILARANRRRGFLTMEGGSASSLRGMLSARARQRQGEPQRPPPAGRVRADYV